MYHFIYLVDIVMIMNLIPQEGQTLQQWYASLTSEDQEQWLPTQSLKVRLSLLPCEIQEQWLSTCDEQSLLEMARDEWWYVARPKQIPPSGPWMVHLALAGRGFGKLIDKREYIPTPDGMRILGSLQIGDQVFDENGQPCNITATHDATPEVAYRLTFSDGSFVDTCNEHQWITWDASARKAYNRMGHDGGRSGVTDFPQNWASWKKWDRYGRPTGLGARQLTTQDIVDTLTYGKRGDTNHCIPNARPLSLPKASLPVEPWLLGYWLGNGTAKSGQLTCHLDDTDHVEQKFWDGGYQGSMTRVFDKGQSTGTPRGLVARLRELGVLDNKHVPDAYLWACETQRRALLAGLLDSDGHLNPANSHVEFCSMTEVLADAVMHLARSLGEKPVKTSGRATLNGVDHGKKFRVTWRPSVNPFQSPRKSSGFRAPDHQALRNRHRMIVAADRIDPTPMRCLTVDSPNSLFLVGEAMIPTHNTKAGSEWIVDRALTIPRDLSGFPTEHLVIAETLSDARIICAEGAAGILRVLERRGLKKDTDYTYVKSPKPCITIIDTRVKIFFEGADGADVGRGYNLASLWADETGKWSSPYEAWYEGILPSLRSDIPGDHPRAFVTTTPKPIRLLQEWLAVTDGSVSTVRGSTFENILNLSVQVIRELYRKYEGTSIGRQELFGEMLDKGDGILFTYVGIERHRCSADREGITFTVVGVDPGLTGDDDGDECGVVVVGKDKGEHLYVLEDASQKVSGRDAAIHAWKVFIRNNADVLVYENNLGKAWMEQVFKDAYLELQKQGLFPSHTSAPIKGVFSTVGKKLRAEPVAMRYEQGKVHHTNRFEKLESQMLTFDPLAPGAKHNSPDRLDALVHACRHLMDTEKHAARIISSIDQPLNYAWDPYQ